RTKHLDIQLQFVRDSIENGTIKLQYCPTDVILADIMTKALARDKHAAMHKLIGMESTSPSPVEDVQVGELKQSQKATSGSEELRHFVARTWRQAWAPRAKFLGLLGSKYIV